MRGDRINRLTGGGKTWRQSEDGVIESADGNEWSLRVNGRDEPYSSVGGTWIDADNQPGEEARIAFVQGSPLLPVFFSRGSKPGSRIVIADEFSPVISGNWLTFRNGYHRPNLWQYDDESQIYLPPSLREPEEEPTSSQINALILRVLDGQLYNFSGSSYGLFGPLPPWGAPALQKITTTALTSGIGSDTTTLSVVDTTGFTIGLAKLGGVEEIYIDAVTNATTLTVTRFSGSTSHAAFAQVDQSEEVARWNDFSLLPDSEAGLALTTPRTPSALNGPTFDGEFDPEFGSPEYLELRDTSGLLHSWPFPILAIEYTYEGDEGPPGGGGGGAS